MGDSGHTASCWQNLNWKPCLTPQDLAPNPGMGQAPLTQSVKSGHQANIHPVFKVCGCQSELEDLGCVLLRKLQAQTGDWVLTPGFQQCLHLLEDLWTVKPLVLIALEAVEEDDKFRITATPQSCAPARGTSLGKTKHNSNSTLSNSSTHMGWQAT